MTGMMSMWEGSFRAKGAHSLATSSVLALAWACGPARAPAEPPAPPPDDAGGTAGDAHSEFALPRPSPWARSTCAHFGPCREAPPFPPGVQAFRECFGARTSDPTSETLTVVFAAGREESAEYLMALSPATSALLAARVAEGVADPRDTADTIRYGVNEHEIGDEFLFQVYFGIPDRGGRIAPLVLDCQGRTLPIRGDVRQTALLPSGDALVVSVDHPHTKETWNITSLAIVDPETGHIDEEGSLVTLLRHPLSIDGKVHTEMDPSGRLSSVSAHLRIYDDSTRQWEGEFRIFEAGHLKPFEVPETFRDRLSEVHERRQLENPLAR